MPCGKCHRHCVRPDQRCSPPMLAATSQHPHAFFNFSVYVSNDSWCTVNGQTNSHLHGLPKQHDQVASGNGSASIVHGFRSHHMPTSVPHCDVWALPHWMVQVLAQSPICIQSSALLCKHSRKNSFLQRRIVMSVFECFFDDSVFRSGVQLSIIKPSLSICRGTCNSLWCLGTAYRTSSPSRPYAELNFIRCSWAVDKEAALFSNRQICTTAQSRKHRTSP